jgi:hypothetical protein
MVGLVCFAHRVSTPTLCPFGQPKKAIGYESQIGPWLPLCNRLCLPVLQNSNGAVMTFESVLPSGQNPEISECIVEAG